jgi:sugar/nucleoside kinase (ribokinase family)
MILVIGETLIDVTQNLTPQLSLEAHPGGAPANVAVMLKVLGQPVRFFTVLGADMRGDFLVDTLKKAGLEGPSIIQDASVSTPFVMIELDQNHVPTYAFYHFADPLKTYPVHLKPALLEGVKVVVGSGVICTHKDADKSQRNIFKIAAKKGVLTAFDFNVRSALALDMVALKNRLLKMTPFLDILKLSEEEYQLFTGDHSLSPFKIFRLKPTAQVIITKGAKGADLHTGDGKYTAFGIPATTVDTTGAGDAFMGAFIHAFLKHPTHYKANLEEANKKAAISTTFKGAMTAFMQFKDQ